jgi:Tfp pilus assembly protein PilZ
MSAGSGASKRRYRRRTVRTMVDYLADSGPHRARATTLGAGGLFIETDSPAAAGCVLKLRFQLAATGAHHEIEGRVVWSKCTGSGTDGMGIEFLNRAATKVLAVELESLD